MDDVFSRTTKANLPLIYGARLGHQPVLKSGGTKYTDEVYPEFFYPPYVSGAGIFMNRVAMMMILSQFRMKMTVKNYDSKLVT